VKRYSGLIYAAKQQKHKRFILNCENIRLKFLVLIC